MRGRQGRLPPGPTPRLSRESNTEMPESAVSCSALFPASFSRPARTSLPWEPGQHCSARPGRPDPPECELVAVGGGRGGPESGSEPEVEGLGPARGVVDRVPARLVPVVRLGPALHQQPHLRCEVYTVLHRAALLTISRLP